mmetsp:Transcript_109559/g.320652  ORF Transcript_109559/g.320652 Transcript_109559/m.320652 type:complete len:200 (-) Transcript_109559:1135-1734(-)
MGSPLCAITRTVPASSWDSAVSSANLDTVKQHATGNRQRIGTGAMHTRIALEELPSQVHAIARATRNEVDVCVNTNVPLRKARAEFPPCCAQLTSRGRVPSRITKTVSRKASPDMNESAARWRGLAMSARLPKHPYFEVAWPAYKEAADSARDGAAAGRCAGLMVAKMKTHRKTIRAVIAAGSPLGKKGARGQSAVATA